MVSGRDRGFDFCLFDFSYFYLASQAVGQWPPNGVPVFTLAGPNTIILLLSSVALIWAERSGARRAARGRLLGGIVLAFIFGSAFVGVQIMEWHNQSVSLSSGTYGAIYFTLTGFHLAHVVAGLVMLLLMLVWAARGYFSRERHAPLTIGAIYWHFVDGIWVVVFATLYLSPRFGIMP